MNKITLIGYLTRDPELSQLPSGVSVCKFGIAVSRSFTNADGERETDFFNVTAWRGLGENCAKYLRKGKRACVVGNVQIRNYVDNNGNRRTAVDVVAEDIEFLSPKDDEAITPNTIPKPKARTAEKPVKKKLEELVPTDDDLPF